MMCLPYGWRWLLAGVLLSAATVVPAAPPAISLIPEPVEVVAGGGVYVLGPDATIAIAADAPPALAPVADELAQRLGRVTGYSVQSVKAEAATGAPAVMLRVDADVAAELGAEGYRLQVTTGGVVIAGGGASAVFFGVQTLLQLLPAAVEGAQVAGDTAWELPCVAIADKPRFAWRGLMLDVSRHFFTVAEVKRFIDEMARFKFNTLHLHLTDDQGWRIEIPAYPKLTEIGAWRVPRQGTFGTLPPPRPGEAATEGGFYTQADIRELVAYAQTRFITIVPEIDVPGHCRAALAAYPEFSCTGAVVTVGCGDKFRGIVPNVLCVSSPRVDAMMETVIADMVKLFPGPYIHIGGDEVEVKFWQDCTRCGSMPFRMALTNFVNRMAAVVERHGRTAVVWDDVMVGDVSTNIVIMNWHEIRFGAQAVRRGHRVVSAPRPFYYLDLCQGEPSVEPPTYGLMRLRDCYRFNPQPPDTAADRVLGAQGNLWTEEIAHYRHAQYMMWPRALAIAESAWSPPRRPDWEAFVPRLERQFARFKVAGVKYSEAVYDPMAWLTYADGTLLLGLDTEIPGLNLHYSFEGEHPDQFYPQYSAPVAVPTGASAVRVAAFRHGVLVGREIEFPLEMLEKRAVARVAREGFGLPRRGWKVVAVSSEQGPTWGGQQALDGDANSFWHTSWNGGDTGATGHPHQVTVDTGQDLQASGFFYLPRQDGKRDDSMIEGFRFEVSRNGKVWLDAVTGVWHDVAEYPIIREQRFSGPLHFRYFRLTSLSAAGGKPYAGAAEIGLLP